MKTPDPKPPLYKTKEYRAWYSAIKRCHRTSDKNWKGYGGRGILVCAKWRKFENFLKDMGSAPSPDHSLDRINNNGNYEPGNCRWATKKEQSRNRGLLNRRATINGKTKLLVEWATDFGICLKTICSRIQRGWSHEDAITRPLQFQGFRKSLRSIKCIENGKTYPSLSAASIDLNEHRSCISKQVRGKIKTVGGYTFKFVRDEKARAALLRDGVEG